MSESFPDDPKRAAQMQETAIKELERLAVRAAEILAARLEHESVNAAFRMIAIPDVSCAFQTHRLLRHLVDAANKDIGGWVESDDAIQALGVGPDVFGRAVLEADEGLRFVATQRAMTPSGYARVRIAPLVFMRLAPKLLPGVDPLAEGMELLTLVGTAGLEGRVSAEQIVHDSAVPLPRAALLFECFQYLGLVETGPAYSSDGLPFSYASILVQGERVVQGLDKLDFL